VNQGVLKETSRRDFFPFVLKFIKFLKDIRFFAFLSENYKNLERRFLSFLSENYKNLEQISFFLSENYKN